MYTCCPGCRTWFRVTEAQLGAARAWVRCGQCLETFDASARLWSEPDEASAPVPWRTDRDPAETAALPEPKPEPQPGPDPVSDPPGEDALEESLDRLTDALGESPLGESRLRESPLEEGPLGDDRVVPSVSLDGVGIDVDLDSDLPGPMVGDVRRVSTEEPQERPGPDRIHEGRIAARRRRSREQAILNRIEGRDDRRGRRWAANSCIALLVLLVFQYAWFMAGDLAATFPSVAPALDEFCAVTGCETNRRSGEEGTRVVSRTVRPHAEYTSALSVKATLEEPFARGSAVPGRGLRPLRQGRSGGCEPGLRAGGVPRRRGRARRGAGVGNPRRHRLRSRRPLQGRGELRSSSHLVSRHSSDVGYIRFGIHRSGWSEA